MNDEKSSRTTRTLWFSSVRSLRRIVIEEILENVHNDDEKREGDDDQNGDERHRSGNDLQNVRFSTDDFTVASRITFTETLAQIGRRQGSTDRFIRTTDIRTIIDAFLTTLAVPAGSTLTG